MKKILIMLLVCLLAVFCFSAGAVASSAGDHQLTLSVSFEKNKLLSTYDVLMYLDNELIATLPHGTDYSGTVAVQSGSHFLTFRKDGDLTVDGSYVFNVDRDLKLSCGIQAKHDQIIIVDPAVQAAGEPDQGSLLDWFTKSMPDNVLQISGSNLLNLKVSFNKNLIMSKYNVELYCDNVLVKILENGEDFNAVLGLSSGVHVITFRKEGSSAVRGICQVNVADTTFYSCVIESKLTQIKIVEESIGLGQSSGTLSKSEYMDSCKTLKYEDVVRYPEKDQGVRIKVHGKVVQSVEGLFNIEHLVIQSSGNYWSAILFRENGSPRIIVGDMITVYGQYSGIGYSYQTYSGLISTPYVITKYYESR